MPSFQSSTHIRYFECSTRQCNDRWRRPSGEQTSRSGWRRCWEMSNIRSLFSTSFQDLQLDHIHGYRGFDCRDNLFYLADNESIVYPAAGAGVVHNIRRGEHRKPVTSSRSTSVLSFVQVLNNSIWIIRMISFPWLCTTEGNTAISLPPVKSERIRRFMSGILWRERRSRSCQENIKKVRNRERKSSIE